MLYLFKSWYRIGAWCKLSDGAQASTISREHKGSTISGPGIDGCIRKAISRPRPNDHPYLERLTWAGPHPARCPAQADIEDPARSPCRPLTHEPLARLYQLCQRRHMTMRSTRAQIDFGLGMKKAQRTGTGFVIHPHQEVDRLQRRRLAVLLPQPRMRTPNHAFAPRVWRSVLQRTKEYLLRMLNTQDRQQVGR